MGRDFQGSGESPSKEGAKALSPRYIQKIVVMHACMRSVANEQFRETRLVIIRRGRFAVGLNPFWMLRAERIVHLALKLGVTRNFSDEDWRTRRVHRLTSDVFALWNRVEDAIPTAVKIEDRHVQHQHRGLSSANHSEKFQSAMLSYLLFTVTSPLWTADVCLGISRWF
jgi:hypothetical protein